jgi:hypothetical protein
MIRIADNSVARLGLIAQVSLALRFFSRRGTHEQLGR